MNAAKYDIKEFDYFNSEADEKLLDISDKVCDLSSIPIR